MADTVSNTTDPKLNRRGFIKGCTMAAAALGLSDAMIPKLVEAASSEVKPRVIWLHFQECTGCTESLLRSSHPDIARLILDIISLDYHETIMAAAGHQAEHNLHETADNHPFILVVEGAIPTKDGGIYCKIAGKTALDILAEIAPKASAIIAIGTCAAFGGVQAASPNPTGAVGVEDLPHLTGGVPIVNIPGCPPNPINFLGTILHYLTFKRWPALDSNKRPVFAYGRRIHDQCERRAHFDEGRFAEKFGDKFHQLGYCLYKVGCKGPETFSNCPEVCFNDVGVWPVSVGHGCIGCTEKNFWDTMTPFYERLPMVKIPGAGIVTDADNIGKVLVGATAVGVAAHGAIGIGKALLKGKKDDQE